MEDLSNERDELVIDTDTSLLYLELPEVTRWIAKRAGRLNGRFRLTVRLDRDLDG